LLLQTGHRCLLPCCAQDRCPSSGAFWAWNHVAMAHTEGRDGKRIDARSSTLICEVEDGAEGGDDDGAGLTRPWHCFAPFMQGRSEGSQRRSPANRTALAVCLCGVGACTQRAMTHEVGCGMNSGAWRCAVLPADSDGEADQRTAPVGDAVERLTPTEVDRVRDTISVTSTCSPSPVMDKMPSQCSEASQPAVAV